MNNRSTSTSRTSQFITNGISLTEMLVAIILLSLVNGFAFTAISTMWKNYLVEAAIASDRISTTMALTSLARQYYENPDFARNAPAAYPVTDDIEWVGIEFEALVQLSEQGEYLADYGLLVEYERDWELNNNEIVVKGLVEREFGRLSVTLNPGIAYEWGENRQDEFETKLSAMLRYRYHPRFEPSFEVHLGQVSKMAGPSVGGRIRLPAPGTSLSYDFGTFFPLDQESSEYTVRLQIVYEF